MIKYFRSVSLYPLILSTIFVLLFFSDVPRFLYAAELTDNFIISEQTLLNLKNEQLSESILQNLRSLIYNEYLSRASFLEVLEQVLSNRLTADVITKIIKYSSRHDLYMETDAMEGSLATSEFVLIGNARIEIPRDGIRLDAQRIEVFSINKKPYKFIATKDVHAYQLGRDITTDKAIYDKTTKILTLEGNIVAKSEKQTLYGSKGFVDRDKEIIDIQGDTFTDVGEKRAKIVFFIEGKNEPSENPEGLVKDKVNEVTSKNAEKQPLEKPKEKPSTLWAEKIHYDQSKGEATLIGRVEMDRPQRQMYMKAEKALLVFNDKRELTDLYAERDVCIQRPKRTARSNRAHFDEKKQTIHLKQNVLLSLDGRTIRSDTIDVDMNIDVEKIEAKGGSSGPIQIIIPLDEESLASAPSLTCK